jgi:hypothetical protein
MKKVLFILSFVFCLCGPVSAQSTRNYPVDLVLVLDTSSSMSAFYQVINDYLTGTFLSEQLRLGDTVHLISFSDTVQVEVARRIMDRSDVEVIVGRMLLMYPLDPYSDIDRALSYTENYVNSLSTGRPKKIILITDGDNNPPGRSASRIDINTLIADMQARLLATGSTITMLTVPEGISRQRTQSIPQPVTPAPSSPSLPETVVVAPPVTVDTPAPSSPSLPETVVVAPPVVIDTPVAQPPAVPDTTVQPPRKPTTQPVTHSPPSLQVRPLPAPLVAADTPTVTIEPAAASEHQPMPVEPAPEWSEPLPVPAEPDKKQDSSAQLIISLILLVILLIAFSIFFLLQHVKDSPGKTIAAAAEKISRLSRNDPYHKRDMQIVPRNNKTIMQTGQKQLPVLFKTKETIQSFDGPPMLSLFVADQNAAIGRQNIHTVKAGYSLTLGGGDSDFLVFLVPLPARIARIRFDGKQCLFIPRKRRFFPGFESVPLNCIGKTIKIVSGRNYEIHIRLERYEDPLKTLNRLLRSVYVPN